MPSYPQMVPPALYNLQPRDIAAYLSTLPRVPPGALGNADGSESLGGVPDVPAGWRSNQFSGIPPTGTRQPEAWMAPPTRRPVGVLMPERVIPTPPELASIAPPTPEPLGPNTAPYDGLIPGEIPDNPWGNSPQIQSYQQPPEMPGGVPRPEIGGANAAMAQSMTQQQPNGRQPFAQLNQVPPNPMQSAAQMPQGQQQPGQQGGSNAMLMGILSAGLGILANNTGHYGAAGPAIGRGGQIGLGTYMQQSQQEIENKRRDALAKAQEARWGQQAEYNKAISAMVGEKATREQSDYQKRQTIIAQLDAETDPIKMRSLVRQLAALEGGAAAIYKADTERPQKPIKSIEGAGGRMRKEVWRDPSTNAILWEGEPYDATGQTISMTLPPTEKAFDIKYGGAQGEIATDVEKMSEKAHGTLDTTNKMMDFAQKWIKGGGQLGKAANVQAFTSSLMQAIGVDPKALGLPADAGPAQALDAISNNFVLSKIGGEGGMPANNFSNADREFLQQTKPNKIQTPEGFILVTMIERGAAQRAIKRDEMLQDELDAFPDDQSEKAYRSFRRKWRAYVKSTPAWTPEQQQEMRQYRAMLGEGSSAIQPDGTGASPGAAWKEKNK